ncbi:MAG: hypothetical protein DYH20_10090 [Gammaproteobacteria bacterium PRO9]|nr:hypothetical protein [Gammaproteobacteria bacterium PRO9]
MLQRWLQNLAATPFRLRRCFPPAALAAIDAEVAASERRHGAEIRCAVETSLAIGQLFAGIDARARAAEVFSRLGMWDTAANNGVLLYILLAEHRIEIVADRGFNGRVAPVQWRAICDELQAACAVGRYREGTIEALRRIGELATLHFPATGANPDELPDRTVLL